MDDLLLWGAVALVGLPLLAAGLLGVVTATSALNERHEGAVAMAVGTLFTGTTLLSLVLLGAVLGGYVPPTSHKLGPWFELGHYAFYLRLQLDLLSLVYAATTFSLVGIIGAFSRRYLHREAGYFRFYFLLILFSAGVELVALGGSLEVIFVGWEIVGLTSALLIAFFHERKKPVEHALRAFMTYRMCDIGLLAAVVWTHHTVGSTDLSLDAMGTWGGAPTPRDAFDAALVGLLLLWATMGKSAQVPLGGWLPRAMEGPTPSSAIFYGAISVHLGPFLLLRGSPLIEASDLVRVAVILIGSLTALHATFVGRVQTDIKSALAYASMTQVGIIFVEIGLGFRYLALVHIVGHAFLRSLQILRSASLLHDYNHLEKTVGSVLPKSGGHLERLVPAGMQPWLYRHALERGYFDAFLRDWVVGTFVRFFRAVDLIDQTWTSWLAGPTRQPPSPRPETGAKK